MCRDLWRSIWQGALATLLCLLIGFPTAWFIATRDPKHRAIWVFLITVPYWVNLLIRTVSLRFLLRDQGPLNEALMGLGVIGSPLRLINTDAAVQLGSSTATCPSWCCRLRGGGALQLRAVGGRPRPLRGSVDDAARDRAARGEARHRRRLHPRLRPLARRLPAPDLLGGAKTYMIGSLIDEQFRGSMGNWPFAPPCR